MNGNTSTLTAAMLPQVIPVACPEVLHTGSTAELRLTIPDANIGDRNVLVLVLGLQ